MEEMVKVWSKATDPQLRFHSVWLGIYLALRAESPLGSHLDRVSQATKIHRELVAHYQEWRTHLHASRPDGDSDLSTDSPPQFIDDDDDVTPAAAGSPTRSKRRRTIESESARHRRRDLRSYFDLAAKEQRQEARRTLSPISDFQQNQGDLVVSDDDDDDDDNGDDKHDKHDKDKPKKRDADTDADKHGNLRGFIVRG